MAPCIMITDFNSTTKSNHAYIFWLHTYQMLFSLLYSSLTEESINEVLGLHPSHEAWQTLEASLRGQRLKNYTLRMNSS